MIGDKPDQQYPVTEGSSDIEYLGSREDQAETRTVGSRKRLREKMDSDIEAFLRAGGKIQIVQPNVSAEQPGKPVSNYGGQPI